MQTRMLRSKPRKFAIWWPYAASLLCTEKGHSYQLGKFNGTFTGGGGPTIEREAEGRGRREGQRIRRGKAGRFEGKEDRSK